MYLFFQDKEKVLKRASIERFYIPKFSGNRELAEADRVTVEMSLASLKEKEKFANMKYLKKGKMEYVRKEYLALRTKVYSIENYFNDNGDPINTAEKLIIDEKNGFPESIELTEELWDRIMGYDKQKEDEEEDENEDFDYSGSGEPLSEKED